MKYLLDTSVLSEVRRPRGNEGVKVWLSSASAGELYLSALVIGEVRRGVERLKRLDPIQVETYEVWLGAVLHDYADRILPIDAEVAEE